MNKTEKPEADAPAPEFVDRPKFPEAAKGHDVQKPEAEKPEAEKPPAKKAVKQYKITFHSGEGEDASDVILGHNHQLNSYKRNVETTIDENFLGVLKDAVVHTTIKRSDGTEMVVTKPRYSYTVTSA